MSFEMNKTPLYLLLSFAIVAGIIGNEAQKVNKKAKYIEKNAHVICIKICKKGTNQLLNRIGSHKEFKNYAERVKPWVSLLCKFDCEEQDVNDFLEE